MCLLTTVSFCPFRYKPVILSVCLPVCLSVCLSLRFSVNPPASSSRVRDCLSACLYAFLSSEKRSQVCNQSCRRPFACFVCLLLFCLFGWVCVCLFVVCLGVFCLSCVFFWNFCVCVDFFLKDFQGGIKCTSRHVLLKLVTLYVDRPPPPSSPPSSPPRFFGGSPESRERRREVMTFLHTFCMALTHSNTAPELSSEAGTSDSCPLGTLLELLNSVVAAMWRKVASLWHSMPTNCSTSSSPKTSMKAMEMGSMFSPSNVSESHGICPSTLNKARLKFTLQ